jgi:hypothetical protein
MAPSRRLEESLLTLAWSLWVELGVSGVVRNHEDCAIDLEPLLLFTASVANLDPRLRDESLDCSLSLAPYLSVARFKNLISGLNDVERAPLARYVATFNAASPSTVRLPDLGGGKPWPLAARGKSNTSDFREASRIMLRLRAVLGVGARADVLGAMMSEPGSRWLTAELAQRVGFTKRQVASVLDDFSRAGLVTATQDGNRLRFSLRRRRELSSLFAPLPRRFPPWVPALALFARLQGLVVGASGRKDVALAVEAHTAIERAVAELSLAGVTVAPPADRNWPGVLKWAESQAEKVASGRSEWLGDA